MKIFFPILNAGLKLICICTLLLCSSTWGYSQTQNSTTHHSPKFAGISSAIVPGTGQIYNQKYWKVPLIYAGLGTAGYFIYYNATVYSNFKNAFNTRLDADPVNDLQSFQIWNITKTGTIYLDQYTNTQLQQIENIYRRYLDLSVIAAGAVYALNIVDAVVDAHLFYFDVSDDLSLEWQPVPLQFANGKSFSGVTLNLNF